MVKFTNGDDADTTPGPSIAVGDVVTWTYVIENTGNATLTDVTLTDDQLTALNPLTDSVTLLAGEVITVTATGTATAGQYTNTATITGTPPVGAPVTDTNPSHYYGISPDITVVKYTNGDDADTMPGPSIAVGDVVTWTYVIENTGNATLTDVTLTDDQLTALNPLTTSVTLVPGEIITVTATGTAVAGQYTNTATATGTPPVGDPVTDTNPSHYFGLGAGIVVTKYTNGDDADTSTPGPEHCSWRCGDMDLCH